MQIPKQAPPQPKHFRAENQRWDLARRILHDKSSGSFPDRVAACLVLLYAQPAARIVTLTRDHVRTTNGAVMLRLGGTEITMPPPLDALLTRLPVGRSKGVASLFHDTVWLFPGRRAGQHLHATSLANRLRALGVDPRADRNTALLQLAAEVPPAVLADLLGIHINTAINWANEATGDWTNYAAIRSADYNMDGRRGSAPRSNLASTVQPWRA